MVFVSTHCMLKVPRVMQAIVDHHYVEDYFDICDTESEAKEIISGFIDIH